MRTGRIFRRCSSCTRPFPRIDGKRAQRCPDHPKAGSSWTYSVDVHAAGEKRKRKTKGGFKSEADAKADMDIVLAVVNKTGTYNEPSKMSVAEYMESWHESRGHTVKASTHKMQGAVINRHFLSGDLATVPLRSLTAPMIRKWHASLLDTNLTGKSVRNIDGILRVAMKGAVDDGLLIINPMPSSRPKASKPKLTELPPEAVGVFLTAVRDRDDLESWVPMYLTFMAGSGLRRSEALALRWLDFAVVDGEHFVTVAHTLADVVEGQPILSTTKTDTTHTIGVTTEMMAMLSEYRLGQVASMHGSVFTRIDGTPVRGELATRTFRRVWDDVDGLPAGVRLHDLRHNWAIAGIESGLTMLEIANQLGHSDTRMLELTYGHILHRTKAKNAAKVASAIGL